MKKKFKFGVIGAGFMATAIIKGVIRANTLNTNEIIVSDIAEKNLEEVSKLGVSVTVDNEYLVNNSDFVLFAIKPQSLNEVLNTIKNCSCDKFISIMAGVKKSKIKSFFPNALVARCMPNTPCSINYGAVGIDLSDFTDADDINFIQNVFTSLATVVLVSEDKLNAVTGVSGSSPAYFYLFLKGIIDAGIKHGLSEEEAKTLATNTMIGAGQMVLNNPDKSLDDLINAVCSKGGTTIQAINLYNDFKLNEISDKAVTACVNRSEELENL